MNETEESRGFRVRVTYPIVQEYRYAVYPNERDWRVADRPKGTVFKTESEAAEVVDVINDDTDIKAVGGTAVIEPIESFDPDWCIPPGVHLAEYMQLDNITAEKMCELLGLTPDRLAVLLNGGDELITPALATKLASATRGSATYWTNLEKRYREGLRMGLTVTR